MKYLILIVALVFSSVAFSQVVVTGTERKVTVANGASYSSFKTNDEAMKAATSLAAQYCVTNQNTVVYYRLTGQATCAKSSSSKSSSSSIASSQSSSSQASSEQSAAQSSSSSSAEITKLSMYRPVLYENGNALPPENIVRYEAIISGGSAIRYVTITPTPDPIIAPIGIIAANETVKVATVAKSEDKTKDVYSYFLTVQRE